MPSHVVTDGGHRARVSGFRVFRALRPGNIPRPAADCLRPRLPREYPELRRTAVLYACATIQLIRERWLPVKSWETLDAVEYHPEKMSGTLVFRGTRVPVAALFENLRDGATVEQFLEWFPGVTKAQVDAVLNHEVETLAPAGPA